MILTIAGKELKAIFASPLAWIVSRYSCRSWMLSSKPRRSKWCVVMEPMYPAPPVTRILGIVVGSPGMRFRERYPGGKILEMSL